MGQSVFSNYTSSAFIPIGIQTEFGALWIEPPTRAAIEKAQTTQEVGPAFFVSPNLDAETSSKFDHFVAGDRSKTLNRSAIILRYHRDVCYKGWKKYIEEGGRGADLAGYYLLKADAKSLHKLRTRLQEIRAAAGYRESEGPTLEVIDDKELAVRVPRYSTLIEDNKLCSLTGFNYDGRVKGSEVMETLNASIKNASAKVTRVTGWVESLQTREDSSGTTVTGVKLRGGEILNADVVVSALGQGAEQVLQTANLILPILRVWGIVYSLPQDLNSGSEEPPTIGMALGIVRDVPGATVNCGLGQWILPKGTQPDPTRVRQLVKRASRLWSTTSVSEEWIKNHPVYVQPRPMTLDGLPVLDDETKGLVVLNPSGSEGNTQAPGSGLFAVCKTLKKLGREVPADLQLPNTVDWEQFKLYPGRFDNASSEGH